jgi:hypothetical protein
MTAPRVPADDTAGGPPAACSLTRAGLAEQADRWVLLAARAMTGRTETVDGLRIRFRPEPGAEQELRALAAVETMCCPWATWTVGAGPAELVLDARSAGDGVAALHSMFTGLRRAPVSVGTPSPGGSAPGDARL